MSDYLADVQRYDAGADEAIVKKIVRHHLLFPVPIQKNWTG